MSMTMTPRHKGQFAIVTGASSGIGRQLAQRCAEDGFDLLIAADEPEIEAAASELRAFGGQVEALQADLATTAGVDQLVAATRGRAVDALLANAGRGLGKGFLDQDWGEITRVIETNITGTIYLAYKLAPAMRVRGQGRILFTGSVAGFIPGSFQAVYNGSKAFIDSFSFALRNELKETGVTVTVLMPGPTDTRFFERAGMLDTQVGTADNKDDPADVAQTGYDAMLNGDGDVVAGVKNKIQAALANVTPWSVLAEMHRGMAEPGSAEKNRK